MTISQVRDKEHLTPAERTMGRPDVGGARVPMSEATHLQGGGTRSRAIASSLGDGVKSPIGA